MINERKQQQEIGRSCNSTSCECDSLGEEREEYAEEKDDEGKNFESEL